ncbi:hypothetical protein O181_009988 [Austropuccinia psidii MF-1]|uniref:Reverse transcriptase domain-containing protein n=1 Tax=Austropuccinia psidii MF-1 TaxID=1389203 RepID=A0A9Q3GJY1_9BASI|nr:hypothetical protein [Austropuccinia psidii MF-1]
MRNWSWWKSQIIQKYSNGTWIWKNTISFEYEKYSVDKDPYEWCLRRSKRLTSIDPQMNIQMRNHKLLTQIPGELEHAVKFRGNQNCTLDEISNTLQDLRKRTNIRKYSPYKSNHYSNNCPKAKKKVYAIGEVPDKESPTEDSESDSTGDAIRAQYDEDQDSREKFLVEYQEETPLEIQDINLEAGMPQDNVNKNLCKHTQDAQTFLVTPTRGMAYINGRATKMTVCIDNAQHPLIIESGAHCSMVARNYLDDHFPNWEKQLLPTKANNFKSASGKMSFTGTIIKEIIIPHRKGKIKGYDIELYLDVERPYPPILRRPPCPASLETRKEIENHINELLEMDFIRKIRHNEILEITTTVLITWHDEKSRFCGDFRALNNYTKADRYPIPRIPHSLDKLEKAKCITKMDCMKGFHQTGV